MVLFVGYVIWYVMRCSVGCIFIAFNDSDEVVVFVVYEEVGIKEVFHVGRYHLMCSDSFSAFL